MATARYLAQGREILKRVAADEPLARSPYGFGDYDDLRAEMDVIAAFSNCPQIHNACNGFHLTPLITVICEYNPT